MSRLRLHCPYLPAGACCREALVMDSLLVPTDALRLNPDAIGDLFDALKAVQEACLFGEDDGGIGVSLEPILTEELFDSICKALLKAGEPPMRPVKEIAADLRRAREVYAYTGPTHSSVQRCELLHAELQDACAAEARETGRETCPYCGLDPYHYENIGTGRMAVAVNCCDEGIADARKGTGKSIQCCNGSGWYTSYNEGFAHPMPCEYCNPEGRPRQVQSGES